LTNQSTKDMRWMCAVSARSMPLVALLPFRGYAALMIEVTAYFDESGSHDSAPVLCLAGFVIEQAKGQEMTERWRLMLDAFGLPFFHMTACANGTSPFMRAGAKLGHSAPLSRRFAAE
jgi:hypothetical protein